MKPWFLYLIVCEDGSIYTGITVDVASRFAAHQAGQGARYTRSHRPVALLGSIEFPDRASASRAEYRVKQIGAAAKRDLARTLQTGNGPINPVLERMGILPPAEITAG